MRGLFGWFSDRPIEDAEAALRGMFAAGRQTAAVPVLKASPHAGFGIFGSEAAPECHEVDGFTLAWIGHPHLVVDGRPREDVAAMAALLRERGSAALGDIHGDFALAGWNSRTKRGFVAVDRIGVRRLVYGRAGSAFVFASTLDLLGGFPGIRRSLVTQGLFDYLFYHVSPGPSTVFEGLLRVPPGHCVDFSAGGEAALRTYWTMRFEERGGRPVAELEEEFLSIVQSSVRDAAQHPAVGAFLSGGTDSSTVSGMLARAHDGKARTFSIGFDVKGYDEMEFARIAAQHYGCEHNAYYVTPADVVEAVPKIAAAYDEPFGNASAIPTYYCAKLARSHGVHRLLAGDGGDELFGGNERYAKHHLLGLYQRVPSALRRGLIEPLLLSAPGIGSVPPLRKLRSYVEQARPPMPLRYESYNLLMHLGPGNVFTPEFLAAVDGERPHQLMHDAFAPYADASLINQMLGIDLRFILADGDLPKVTGMCELADVDVTFPLLDERLVEFSRLLPSDLKLRGTQLRWFFKHALRNFLPPAVITKQKHGFGLPVGAWLTQHKPLYELAGDSIARIRQRGIVQPQFIDDLFNRKLHEHAAYYGTMVWLLMMLSLWLDSRKL